MPAPILSPGPRQPVLFIGHGSPLNVIQPNDFRPRWEALGREFGATWPRPQLILCISAHWLTQGWWLTGMAQPRTIHDFGGFPRELFEQRYPAPGAPALAHVLATELRQPGTDTPLGVDEQDWGYDHGCWGVLKPMFPQADIPVIQLSMDYARPPADHYALGQQLRRLRERGVLIVASGNIVHNLRTMRREAANHQAYDWAIAFDRQIGEQIAQGQLDDLQHFLQQGELARLAHPTHEHLLPLLYAAGAADPGETVRFFNDSFQGASISMRSVIWG
ncbi:4,5-DOPA dioxygenase extradiol [Rhodoferax sp. BAB1]|uniref:4,5-DOPA-extradiol-dioxygenase n=1 Tax=Rhodoferax sp. BAB1 TaxID=2741720 RepID=UPI001575AD49|nr:4,5-DOPA dioxygenase extradiol [Rhodoferax sp. BAB1]QKO21574.1 4,5-DOPA dioxygenase extradiol [Rhodoferax sp. BAB1]